MPTIRNRTHLLHLVMLAAPCTLRLLSQTAAAGDEPAGGAALREALTFYASFDHGTDADLARGERRLYSAPSLGERTTGSPGLPESGAVTLAPGEGRCGDALRFVRPASEVVFYQVERNFQYTPSDWSGSVSFWLKLDPDRDLGPGYCDPLFITPRTFNDGALWVDFSDQPPRSFRHGAFPDRQVWDPALRDFDAVPEAKRPLVTVTRPPFSRERWTHIVVTFTNFNTGRPDGVSTLYLNGEAAGSVTAREQTYTWEPTRSTAVLGINYVGLFDELAFFNRPLTPAEVNQLYLTPDSLRAP